MRATTLIAMVGIPAYALFMVLEAPATFIANRASRETAGRVQFTDPQGTLWSGSLRADVGAVTLERIAWRLVPAKLVEGRIAFDVDVESPDVRGKAQVLRGWSDWEVRGGSARVDARALPAFFPIIAAWRPEGAATLAADGLRWNDREVLGNASLEWRDAAVALSEVKPLGSYRLAANGVGETAKLALSTLSGPLQVIGQGEAKRAGGVTFSGEARAEGASAAAIEPLLNLMGPKRPDGARSIEVRIR